MRVVGTAGHVDHGKSTLVAALTGIHPDRLKEEQEREMTIDLGFAWMTLPGGEQLGIVDVPGHRDFIENMLAGVGGIDAVLFVVAADEGVMPQTREHLNILDLLQIDAGVIVLTKTDIIDDPAWLELVEEDVRRAFKNTVLEDAPLVRVSARTGAGLAALISALESCLADCPARLDLERPRLPVDRVFSIPGFGTVVTGTLTDGKIKLGDEVEIIPSGLRGRIRGLQSHKHKEQSAAPGSRTAVNISGLNVEQIHRGDVVVSVGKYQTTRLVDVWFRLLSDASGPLCHNSEVKLFIGAADIQARVRLLGVDELKPGQEGWLQLDLRSACLAVPGDRYILRRPSPGETLGGGVVIDAHPKGRHKRFAPDVFERLELLRSGSPVEILIQAFQSVGVSSVREIIERARLPYDQAQAALAELAARADMVMLEAGDLIPDADLLVCSRAHWEKTRSQATHELEVFHKNFPLRRGMPREELKSRLRIHQTRVFNAFVRQWLVEGMVAERGPLIWMSGHTIQFSSRQQELIDQTLRRFAQAPFSPPSIKEVRAEVGEELYQTLVDSGALVPVSADVVFRAEDFERMFAILIEHLQREETITAAQFRDLLNTSRRYVLAFLEFQDAAGITRREGDMRRLQKNDG